MIQHSRLPANLTSRLQAVFGRPVEVGGYNFSLWAGPVLEAHNVVVAEDPRFGHEYFLRADSMAIHLRWQSLLRGRVELGTLSFSRPSLNLVRNAAGEWNLAEWLPRPSGTAPRSPLAGASRAASPTAPVRRIEIDGGRINFKRGDEKLPFALLGVVGTVETEGPGRWRINLEVTPWRSAVIVQNTGSLRVSGHIGGTSSRLHPAELDVSWSDASVADVLRLVRGDDSGIRGQLNLSLHASTRDQSGDWSADGRVQLRQIHRWDLPLRPDNPAINLSAHLASSPSAPYVEISGVLLEAPHSVARASGHLQWSSTTVAKADAAAAPSLQLAISSSQIDSTDLLSWVRAFHAGVWDDLAARGVAAVRATLSGWPLVWTDAEVTAEQVELISPRLPAPVRFGPLLFRYDRGQMALPPATLSWRLPGNPHDGSFRIEVLAKRPVERLPVWRAAGSARELHDLVLLAEAFGGSLSRGWELAGPFACDLEWQGAPIPWQVPAVGWVELGAASSTPGGASLHLPFLNQPVEQIKARADLKADGAHIALASAQAFGARWSGSFDRRTPDASWHFTLSADRLSAADLDRWLNPRWRQSFIGRVLPFLGSRAPSTAIPENLRADGRLSLGDFTLAPLAVNRLQGNLRIEGRHLEFTQASGQFYGGTLGASLDARLDPTPSYNLNAEFSQVDIAALSGAWPDLVGLFAGAASGEASFETRGTTRENLANSLACRGTVRVGHAQFRSLDLAESLRTLARSRGTTAFGEASAAFTCAQGKLQFQNLLLAAPGDTYDGSGTVDFRRNLDLRLHVFPRAASVARAAVPSAATASGPPAGSESAYQVTGSLAAPQFKRLAPPPRRPH